MSPTEYGPPPASFPEDRQRYDAGYQLGKERRFTLSPAELRAQLDKPCMDSFTEGFQDGLSGAPHKHGVK